MALEDELMARQQAWESRVGQDVAGMIAGDIADLAATGILERAARPGMRFPVTDNLVDPQGQPFDPGPLLAGGPLVVSFYRGGWCPYCNLELQAYQQALPEIRAAGAGLVAVSPELPDHSLTTAEKNALDFTVLSDVGGELAAALGIRFDLSDAVRPYYEKAGHALPERHGDGRWSLPLPATFVMARGGVIAAAFIGTDYRRRPDPAAVLAVLKGLQDGGG